MANCRKSISVICIQKLHNYKLKGSAIEKFPLLANQFRSEVPFDCLIDKIISNLDFNQ